MISLSDNVYVYVNVFVYVYVYVYVYMYVYMYVSCVYVRYVHFVFIIWDGILSFFVTVFVFLWRNIVFKGR